MAIKRKNAAIEGFSMASMTDIIFLLLIFFMVISTLVVPNAIRVNLPSAKSTASQETILARITLTQEGDCLLAIGKEKPFMLPMEELGGYLQQATAQQQGPHYAALYADKQVPYGDIVKVLNTCNELNIQLLLATKALSD